MSLYSTLTLKAFRTVKKSTISHKPSNRSPLFCGDSGEIKECTRNDISCSSLLLHLSFCKQWSPLYRTCGHCGGSTHWRRPGAEFERDAKKFRGPRFLIDDFFLEKFPFSRPKFLMTFF